MGVGEFSSEGPESDYQKRNTHTTTLFGPKNIAPMHRCTKESFIPLLFEKYDQYKAQFMQKNHDISRCSIMNN